MAWINPRYKELTGQEPPSAAVAESPEAPGDDVRLATLKRPRRDGPEEELRVTLDDYEGHRFVQARVWVEAPMGGRYPTKKGISIRLREIPEVIQALDAAVRLAERAERIADGPGPRGGPGPGGGRRGGYRAEDLPPVPPADGGDLDDLDLF